MQNAILHPRIIRAFLRMYVEVGACIWAFATVEHPALKATGLLAAYHLGALLRSLAERHILRPIPAAVYFLPVALLLTALGYTSPNVLVAGAGMISVGFLIPASSFGAEAPGASPPRTAKILAKLFGMTMPAIIPISLYAYLAIGLLAALVIIWRTAGSTTPSSPTASQTSWRPIDLTNVFHQAGYFAFCFAFWGLIPSVTPSFIALLFPLGWVAYWVLEHRLTADPRFQQSLLTAGHFAFAATLMAMAASTGNVVAVLLAWSLTGLFGGTCYTMDHAPGGRPSSLSDDLGAMLGSFTGTLAIAGTGDPSAAAILGAGFACAAAMAAFHLNHTNPERG